MSLRLFSLSLATAPDDYTAAPVTITVPANAMMECVAVDIVDDGVAERTESFNVILQAGSNPDVEVDRLGFLHTVFIEDDDGKEPFFHFCTEQTVPLILGLTWYIQVYTTQSLHMWER